MRDKDRIIYYSCGHTSEGTVLNLDEQNQTEILEMIEKGVVRASAEVCPDYLEKDKDNQTIKIYRQSGILPK